MLEIKGKYTDAKIFIDNVEDGLFEQIYSVINSPASKGLKVAIQCDCHVGAQICVGFTMELGTMLTPNWIGVDIGCGMLSARFSDTYKLNLEEIDTEIRRRIPMGFEVHDTTIFKDIPFGEVQRIADIFATKFNEKFGTSYTAPTYNEKWLEKKLKDIDMDAAKFHHAIGTLGSGNHFAEIGRSDTYGDYWVTFHSGSRNFGLKIADYWNNVANRKVRVASSDYNKEMDEIVLKTVPKSDIPKKLRELKDKYKMGIDKEFLMGDDLIGYLFDMVFAQQYAVWNRETMLNIFKDIVGISKFDEIISTTHNYVDFNDFIIRKGAIASYKGQKMIIPFNMRDGILLCEGKSNEDWNFSAPHGAGRLMSRSEAKKKVDLDKFKKSMEGIYSTSVGKETLDESPFAYKDSKIIEEAIEPTATIIDRIIPILNIKDCGKSESWKERKAAKKERDRKREVDRDASEK